MSRTKPSTRLASVAEPIEPSAPITCRSTAGVSLTLKSSPNYGRLRESHTRRQRIPRALIRRPSGPGALRVPRPARRRPSGPEPCESHGQRVADRRARSPAKSHGQRVADRRAPEPCEVPRPARRRPSGPGALRRGPDGTYKGGQVANTKSAMKRIRQSETRRVRNRTIRSQVRTAVKTARAAGGDALRTAVADAIRALDKAAPKGVVHRNAVARKKA